MALCESAVDALNYALEHISFTVKQLLLIHFCFIFLSNDFIMNRPVLRTSQQPDQAMARTVRLLTFNNPNQKAIHTA